ncbi:MAG: TlpA family protein disulfide reductase [Acidimicrobiales bacterium]
MAAGVALMMGLFVYVLATRPPALDQVTPSPLLGEAAPMVSGPSVTPASFESLSGWRGRWVLVNFFATWCVPCQHEHPELIAFMARHQHAGDVGLVMVIYDDQVSKVQGFFRDRGGDWPAVADPDGRVALNYGVSGVPETYVVNPAGVIVAKLVGGVTAAGLDRLLASAQSSAG